MNRKLKVHRVWTSNPTRMYPQIRLQGQWVREAGFEKGEYITVQVEKDKITIKKES